MAQVTAPADTKAQDNRQRQHADAVPAAEEAALGPHPAVSSVSTDHGRRARRTIKVALAPAWIEFAGAAQVAQLRRIVTRKGRKTIEVIYLITSDSDAGPAALAAWARGHQDIENKLHWVHDASASASADAVGSPFGSPVADRPCDAYLDHTSAGERVPTHPQGDASDLVIAYEQYVNRTIVVPNTKAYLYYLRPDRDSDAGLTA
jgi:hypothetical protein